MTYERGRRAWRDPVGRVRAEGSLAHPVPADRRVRVPVRPRDGRARRPVGRRRVALRPSSRRTQRVRSAPGSRGGVVRGRSDRRAGAGRPSIPPRHERPRDHVADPDRLAARAGRARHRAVVRRPSRRDLPASARRLPGRDDVAARRRVHQRHARRRRLLRAGVRVRPPRRHVVVRRRGVRPSARAGCAGRSRTPDRHGLPARDRGSLRDRPHADGGRRAPLRRALVGTSRPRPDLGRRSAREDRGHVRILARLVDARAVPRPPLARVPATERPRAEGAAVRPDRRPDGCGDDVAARRFPGASATGTTATAGSATRRSRCGASTRSGSCTRREGSSTSSATGFAAAPTFR